MSRDTYFVPWLLWSPLHGRERAGCVDGTRRRRIPRAWGAPRSAAGLRLPGPGVGLPRPSCLNSDSGVREAVHS